MVIWAFPKTFKEKHGPRIKVQIEKGDKVRQGKWVTMTISDHPKVIGKGLSKTYEALVKNFVIINKENLLKYWNDELGISTLIKELK